MTVRPASTGATQVAGVFVNLPVRDLDRALAFFGSLGFGFDPRFTDATAACLQLGGGVNVMLLTHAKFAGFAPHPIADAQRSTGVLVALQLADRAQVDDLVRRAVAAGGRTFRPPEDHGFMYGHAFQDLDGHVWEPFHMDLDSLEMQPGAAP